MKLVPCSFQFSNGRVCSYFVFDFIILESNSFSFKLNKTNYYIFYNEVYRFFTNPPFNRLTPKFNVLVNKKEQKYLFQGVLLEFIDFAHDTGICSFCYDAFKIDNILNINLENCLTYIPLYSTEPMCLSKQKTEFELIEEELDLWLTNPAEFFDKKIAGNIKYL